MDNQIIQGLNSYLTFKLGDEKFVVNIGHVKKILEMPEITKVPHVPDYYLGVINLFGDVLPVIDGRTKFELDKKPWDVNTCIIVLMLNAGTEAYAVGIVVDQVLSVIDVLDDELKNPPSIGSKFKHEFIRAIAKINSEFIIVLDEDKLFNEDNLNQLISE